MAQNRDDALVAGAGGASGTCQQVSKFVAGALRELSNELTSRTELSLGSPCASLTGT